MDVVVVPKFIFPDSDNNEDDDTFPAICEVAILLLVGIGPTLDTLVANAALSICMSLLSMHCLSSSISIISSNDSIN